MSNARKLQTEIDRVMKKVDEGVELFDEIWEKVYSAEQQNQKEKYEMDLKKEIKKLQRLRDQIKSWIGSSDVKDKDPLIDARKLIETKMEAFKYCEKETKTKTYSKEGLAKAEKLTPEEEAKKLTSEWIADIIDKLTEMVEERDLEVERLGAGRGKKTNKNLIEECNHFLTMHKFHLTKLEGINRLVNNDVLDVDVVDPVKEDLEYYIESYEDDDYQQAYDEDFFYEALGLDELQVVNVDRVTQASAEKEKNSKNKADLYSDLASSSSKGSEKGNKKSKKGSTASSMIPLTIGRARKGGKKAARLAAAAKGSITGSAHGLDASNSGDDDSTHGNTPTKIRRGVVGTLGVPTPTAIPTSSTIATGTSSMAAILKRETEQQEKERAQKAAEQLRLQQLQQQQQQAAQLRAQQQQAEMLRQQQEAQLRQQQAEAAAKQKALQEQQLAQQAAQMRQQQETQMRQQQQLQQQAAAQLQQQQQQQQSDGSTAKPNPNNTNPNISSSGGSASGLDIISGLNGMSLGIPNSGGGSSGASTAGSVGSAGHHRRGLSGGEASILSGGGNRTDGSLLQESFATLPTSNEHDRTTSRSNSYAPQNPYPSTPASFPSGPNAIFENPAIFEKLGTDALFYIFYYKQGTYQQYLAARELKKQSWRFHKKYMTWFQRHEEPKVTTDDYEQGTCVYFDWETGWCTRIKQEFTFEYVHLEDTLQ